MIDLTPLQKLPKNVGDLGKLIADKGFKKLPKVQKIAKSGHTVSMLRQQPTYHLHLSVCVFILICPLAYSLAQSKYANFIVFFLMCII